MVNTITLYLVSNFTKGLEFDSGITTLLFAGAGLTGANLVVKPLINLLLLPLNMVTFNFFKWISSAIALYLVTMVVPGFRVVEFVFEGFSSSWISIPQISMGGIFSYVLFSVVISLITSSVYWLIR